MSLNFDLDLDEKKGLQIENTRLTKNRFLLYFLAYKTLNESYKFKIKINGQ